MKRCPGSALPFVRSGVLLAAVLAGGCDDGAAPRTGGTAVIALGGAPQTTNPLAAADLYSALMHRDLLYVPLLRPDPSLAPSPGLAESWELEGDSAVVFRLRRDVVWSDSVPTTAADVVFTLERALDPATAYPDAASLSHFGMATAVDSYTVRLSTAPVREPLVALTRLPILPRHALDTIPPGALAEAPMDGTLVTNGPFRFSGIQQGDSWVFQANDRYAESLGGRPHLDRLIWREIPESAAQEAELRAGEVDLVIGVRPDRYDELAAREGLRGLEHPTLSYSAVAWNGRRPPLDDPRVRRALTLAIDRRQILEALRAGHGELATSPVPPSHWAHAADLEPLPHDPERARALLAEAGVGGAATSADSSSRSTLTLRLLVPAESDFNRDLAEVVQSDLREVGVALELRLLEFATLVETITGADRDFDAVLIGLDATPRVDLRSFLHSEHLDGPFQLAGYSDPAMDSLLDRIDGTRDAEAARPLWREAQERIRDAQPWSYLYHLTELVVARDRLRGVEADLRGVLHSAPSWWVAEAEASDSL